MSFLRLVVMKTVLLFNSVSFNKVGYIEQSIPSSPEENKNLLRPQCQRVDKPVPGCVDDGVVVVLVDDVTLRRDS